MENVSSAILPFMNKLSDNGKISFTQQYKKRKKSKGIAFAVWFFTGCHYAYFGKWGMLFLFWFTWGGMGVWWLIDGFRISGIIDSMNEDIAMDTFQKISVMDK